MQRRSPVLLALACLAMLCKLLGAGLGYAGQLAANPPATLLWGGFCSASGVQLAPIVLPTDSAAPAPHDTAAKSGSCCCGAGGAPALPASYRPPLPAALRAELLPAVELRQPPPYRRWPRLNPRASPLA